jgi:nucleoprotein TPR
MSPGGSRMRGGLSTTQLYSENTQLKKELRTLQDEKEKLSATLQDMVEELESRQPEIDELRQENERLTTETSEISSLAEEALREREVARKETRKYQGDYQGLKRESDIQQQQLRDVSYQLKVMILQVKLLTNGETLTPEQEAFLQKVEQNQIPAEDMNDTTDTGRLISQHLVLFKDISQLQEQNAELLRTIRAVADKYEGTEAMAQSKQIEQDRNHLRKLREQVAQYEDEIKSLNLRSQSLTKERDMYRRIVTSRSQAPPGSDALTIFGQSANGATPPPGSMPHGIEQSPHTKEIAGYEKLIKDLQSHMDALRQETATDHATLKQEADRLTKENSHLKGDNMKLNGTIQLASDRYDLLQSKLGLLQSENNELKKRCETLQDFAAKQDTQTQQVAENLAEAKSLAESLERENANLKATRDTLKSSETRYQTENAQLMEDRGRLNRHIADLQNLQNERELTDSENRRRLQTRAESLESELQTAKRRLEEEIEDRRRATLLLENDQIKARNNIDDLRKALNDIRPELASVKTERDHLQARVDELKTELRLAEDRTQTLQPRLTPRVNGSAETNGDDLSRTEELVVENSDLRRQLEATQEDLESANAQKAQYEAIAQNAEEEHQSLLEAQEQLQQEYDRVIAEKDATIQDLQQRLEEISSELSSTNNELSEARRARDEHDLLFTQQKEQLESEITRLKEDADRYKETAAFHQKDCRAQAEIATRAQQNYENELVKHSDAMKNLQKEREQHNQLKTEVGTYKAQAEAARTSQAQSEDHWTETRERYERDLVESRTKLNDLSEQNKILHQQMESFSTQIANLKQSRVSVGAGDVDATMSDGTVDGRQEIINYLRQEKEILEAQHELSTRENGRLTRELSLTKEQLEQTREKLSAEQQSNSQSKLSASSAAAYERTVEQLNTLRESNSTLRNENRQAQARLEERKKEIDDLYSQIQPLQIRVQELESELENNKADLEVAERARAHFENRANEIMTKWGRADPEEQEAHKAEVESLKTERDQLQEQINSFEERLESEKQAARDAATAESEAGFQERREKWVNQFKERSRKISGESKEKDTVIQNLTQELDTVRLQLASAQEELEATKAARDEAIANAAAAANVDTVMGEDGQIPESNAGLSAEERQALEERVAAAEQKLYEESNRVAALQIEVQTKDARISELENHIVSSALYRSFTSYRLTLKQVELQQRVADGNKELDEAKAQAHEAQYQAATQDDSQRSGEHTEGLQSQLTTEEPATTAAPTVSTNEPSEELEKLKEELAAKQKEVEDLRTQAEIVSSSAGTGVEEGSVPVAEQVAQQVAAIKAEFEANRQEQESKIVAEQQKARDAEEKSNNRTETMKKKLNEVLKKKITENEEALKNLKAEHESELERLKSEHGAQINQLRQQLQASAAGGVEPLSTQSAPTETSAAPTTAGDAAQVKTEDFVLPDWDKAQTQTFIAKSPHAYEILSRNIRNKTQALEAKLKEEHTKQVEELKEHHAKEMEELKAKGTSELETPTQGVSQEEHARLLEQAKANVKAEVQKGAEAKLSLHKNRADKAAAEMAVVQKAATETPQRPVGEVYVEAKAAKAARPTQPPKPAANTQAATLTSQGTPAQAGQPAPQAIQSAAPGIPQPNGAAANPFGQSTGFGQSSFAQPGGFGRPSQPFAQSQGNQPFGQPGQFGRGIPVPNQAAQPFSGFTGLAQPGFSGSQNQGQPQNTATTSRPNSPFTTQPQQGQAQGQQAQPPPQAGRGRGQDSGTGPAALRNLVGQAPQGGAAQTGIPRPGGGIPRPAGRGQQSQPQNGPQGAGQSQIGRGGGRGGRGGRGGSIQTNIAGGGHGQGGQGQGQNSPRQLNPNAGNFQPGVGRGQKRTADEAGAGEGDAGHQGGKRPRGGGRGGRGGQAGGGEGGATQS